MRHGSFILLIIAVLLIGTISASAAAPNLINYQGRVTTPAGDPVPDGTYLIQLRIYDAATAGNTLWDNSYRTISLTKGLFSYQLGDSVALPANLFTSGSQRWLGIKVGTDPEISPRTQLVSVPFSKEADHASSADTAQRADTAQLSLNEPGIATGVLNAEVNLFSNFGQDILDVTITTPADGYILVDGKGYGAVLNAAGVWNMGWVQIDTSAGGNPVWPYAQGFGFQNAPNANPAVFPFYVTRTYYKTAGIYTFRMVAGKNLNNGGAAQTHLGYPMIRAMYVPVAYGAVAMASQTPTGVEGERVEQSTSSITGTSSSVYVSDLRQLELQAEQARLKAEQAKRKALEAQLQLERAKGEASGSGR